ncbi:hypothetical protein BOX15_Mlig014975g1 [Macrostomum lignano]|uniref:JAB1/MPN/MOV34 metalloenzyme domain-containing protein n=1 Tax=Macrostomum lignano TaxID=282301 RepID=A0A267EQM1_9PLAT|nr:hypothetical protein BOX15_Mlig014975g1 [Macrostomum lignano]
MSQAADATAAAGAAADDSQALPPSLNPGPPPITKVIVHPLVLLSVVDHYNRLEKVSVGHRRCIGVLLAVAKATYWTSATASPSRSRRTRATGPCGSWTTTTWRPCSACSRRSTPRSASSAGTTAARGSARTTSASTS